MKTLLLFFSIVILYSCTENKSASSSLDNYNLDTYVTIFVKDQNGDNLINTPNYESENFRVYYMLNGQTVEIYNPLMQAPRNFYIYNDNDQIRMRLFLNYTASETFPITYIKWNETDTDTLKASFQRGENFVSCNSVWLNGELVWNRSIPPANPGRTITIIK